MESTKQIIKKYKNRKMWSYTINRYINHTDLRDLIKQGYEVEVLDHVTGVDITQVVLLQAYIESLNPSDYTLDTLTSMVENTLR